MFFSNRITQNQKPPLELEIVTKTKDSYFRNTAPDSPWNILDNLPHQRRTLKEKYGQNCILRLGLPGFIMTFCSSNHAVIIPASWIKSQTKKKSVSNESCPIIYLKMLKKISPSEINDFLRKIRFFN